MTYWGKGTFVGKPAQFGVLCAVLIALFLYALSQSAPAVSLACLGTASAMFLYLWLGPRVAVGPTSVTLYSWTRSVTLRKSELPELGASVRVRKVWYLRGAAIPELTLQDGRTILLPMFTGSRAHRAVPIPRVLSRVEDLQTL